jgi:HEAT repeat protein
MKDQPSLDTWIAAIRSDDPMTFEDAYFGPRPEGAQVVTRLVVELRASADSYARGKFCELLGEMGDQSVVPVLLGELEHSDENVREWARRALEELQSEDARAEKRKHLQEFGGRSGGRR